METIDNNANLTCFFKTLKDVDLDKIKSFLPDLVRDSIDQSKLIDKNSKLLDESIIKNSYSESNPNKVFDIMKNYIMIKSLNIVNILICFNNFYLIV